MSQLLLHNARLVLEDGVQRGGVLVREGQIAKVFAGDETPAGLSSLESVDLEGAYLSPGLIDIHIHGSAGVDVQSTDVDGLANLSAFLLSEGVTGFFPTLVPTDEDGYRVALATLGSYIEQQNCGLNDNKRFGARILGIHFEGPFVSEHRCGALRTQHFRTYDGDPRSIELFTGPQAAGVSRLMTLAPETAGGLDLTTDLVRKGVRAFIGHTQADPETLDRSVLAGARHITHFPNALDPLHHRKPGAVAWGLLRNEVTLDCIADLHHVHPLMLRLIYESKGADRMALISDAILAAGLGDGDFTVWGEKISVRDGLTALGRKPGAATIAGSVITMRQAVRNICGLGVPIHEAVCMASGMPARVAGIESTHGSIKEGKRADLVAFDDEFVVRLSLVGGLVKFNK